MNIQLLKVAKFYRRLYGGGHKLAPNIQTSVNFRNFAEHPFQNLEIPPLMVLSLIVCYTEDSHSLTSQVAKIRPVLYRPSPARHLSSYVWKGPENSRSQNM